MYVPVTGIFDVSIVESEILILYDIKLFYEVEFVINPLNH